MAKDKKKDKKVTEKAEDVKKSDFVKKMTEAQEAKKKSDKKEAKAEVKEPPKEGKEKRLYLAVVKVRPQEDGSKIFIIKNLDDFPKDIKKALAPFHEKVVTDKSKKQLKKTLAAVGCTSNKDIGVLPRERAERQAPPKFVARDFVIDGVPYRELGHNTKNNEGTMYLVQTTLEKGEGKKKKTKQVEMLLGLIWVGNNTVYWVDPATENAVIGTPDMLKARKIWNTDDEGNKIPYEASKDGYIMLEGDCIPVKNMTVKEEKSA